MLEFHSVHDHAQKYDGAFKDALYQVEEFMVPVDTPFDIILMFLDKFTQNVRSKLISRKACRLTRSRNA